MTKFYVVKKDHPVWRVGAILQPRVKEDSSKGYETINESWNKPFAKGLWWEGAAAVENSKEWFEEVHFLEGFGYLSASSFAKLAFLKDEYIILIVARKLGIKVLPDQYKPSEDE
jgi:uncharacterized cupin superfamily protein